MDSSAKRPQFDPNIGNDLQAQIRTKGEEIFSLMEGSSSSIFNKDWWYGRIMEWSMKNDDFKTQMFRFVDVLPYLNSSNEVARHLKEYFAEKSGELPSVFNFGIGMGSLAPALLAGAVRKNVVQMAKMFITGETPQQALPALEKARKQSMCFTLDLLGEATLSEKEAEEYFDRYSELVEWLSEKAKSWPNNPLLDEDEKGAIPKVNVSVKVTSLYSQINEAAWEDTLEVLKTKLRPILRKSVENFVFVNIDMEQYAHKNLTIELFKQLLMEPEFKNYRHFGIVIQAYLRDSHKDTEDLIQFAKERGTDFTIRLVKGAYWDYEVIHAQQMNWPIPVYTNKKESDYNYEQCTRILLENYPYIRLAVGSHNVRSIAAALTIAEALHLPKKALEVQMLYGMAEPIKKAIIKQGYRLREYATIGDLIPGMAYLVRRLLENTSNESFLRSKFAENIDTATLLQDPGADLQVSHPFPDKKHDFENAPMTDFSLETSRHKMLRALKKVEGQLGQKFHVVIGKKSLKSSQSLKRYNPSHPNQLVGEVYLADTKMAEKAVEAALQARESWEQTPAEERAAVLDRLANLIEKERFELSALEVYEVGKPWSEADGDIVEAIDFCRFYAKEMRKMAPPQRVGHAPGEVSHYHYQPRGVALVIAPWNFPLAILTGMVTASMVTGNTVIMKPAEQSSVIGAHLMRLLKEAGCPPGVVNFLPGLGEEVGEYLTSHPKVDLIAFTGSKQVGLHILNKSGDIQRGQRQLKKCIIEMGGKNALIIDSDADLDEAVAGVIYSAFGFQGQKCSACSRAIVLDGIYDRFMDRLLEAAKSFHVGYAENPRSFMGPVVDKEAKEKIFATIEDAKSYAQLAYQGEVPSEGHFVPPTIFADVDPQSPIAQEEIFGPVLAVLKAKDINHAITLANDVPYGLTGGLYSRSPENIKKVRKELEVGNLYINRGITGAIVDRHPFGGFKMSGIGSKTGGPDYLIHFVEPRVVVENTMRRGFAPEE